MRSFVRHYSSASPAKLPPPVIRLSNATFYRNHPSSLATPSPDDTSALFPDLSIELPSERNAAESWGIIGARSSIRTAFLHALKGDYICVPPTARSYPYLSTDDVARRNPALRSPTQAIKYVGFDAERGGSLRGAYLAQRYESKRERTDFSLRDYLLGQTELNPAADSIRLPAQHHFDSVIQDFKLRNLLDMPVNHLSNGQTRRSKIAKALLESPEVLLLDSPFSTFSSSHPRSDYLGSRLTLFSKWAWMSKPSNTSPRS
jgi:hypothetical protein